MIKKGMAVESDGSIVFEDAVNWVERNIQGSEKRVVRARKAWEKGDVKLQGRTKEEGARGPKKAVVVSRSNKPSMSFSEARCQREIYSAKLKKLEVMEALEDVQNSVETRGSPELVVYAAWAWAGGGVDSLPSWSSNFGKCR